MKSKSDPRHSARKLAMSSIFCWLFSEQDLNQGAELSKELLEESQTIDIDTELAKHLVTGVQEHLDEIDKIITESAPEWPLDKIAKVDLVILRIGVFEVLFGKKTPTRVAIDEAVELAKEFGNETSHKFVNGVLGTIVERSIDKSQKE